MSIVLPNSSELVVRNRELNLSMYPSEVVEAFNNKLIEDTLSSTLAHYRPIGIKMSILSGDTALDRKSRKERVVNDNTVVSINLTSGMSVVDFMTSCYKLILVKGGGSQSLHSTERTSGSFSYVSMEIDSMEEEPITSSNKSLFYSEEGTSAIAPFLVDDVVVCRPSGNPSARISMITLAFFKGVGIYSMYDSQSMLNSRDFYPFYANFSLSENMIVMPYKGDSIIRFMYKDRINDNSLSILLQEYTKDLNLG